MASIVPPDILFGDELFDLAMSPTASIVATASITGELAVFRYSAAGNESVFKLQGHTSACRSCVFSTDGNALFSVSSDKTIQCIDVTTGTAAAKLTNAHSAAINCALYIPDTQLLSTGDDDGNVKMWDVRQQKCIGEYEHHGDYISDMACVPHKKVVLCASGDGTISVIDWRSGSTIESEQLEDEPISIEVMGNSTKVVVGTQEGTLGIYSWGEFGDISDRMLGHPKSVDAMCKIDERTLCTGSSDGLVRAVNIKPNKILGVIGEHEGFPVERMRLSGDGTLIGSCSHDKRVKFWDVGLIQQGKFSSKHGGVESGAGDASDGEWEDTDGEGDGDDAAEGGGAAADAEFDYEMAGKGKGKGKADDFFGEL